MADPSLPDAEEPAELDGRRLRGQRTRQQILDAATRLFRERGFLGVSMEAIGEAAGVSGAAIYRHFAGKEEVLVAVLDPVLALVWPEPVTANAADPFDALDRYVDRFVRTVVDHPDLVVLWYQEWRNLPQERQEEARRLVRRSIDHLARILRKARPELSANDSRVVVDAALRLATYVGHPGSGPRLPADHLYEVLTRLGRATLRA